jgi:hypothetical protein
MGVAYGQSGTLPDPFDVQLGLAFRAVVPMDSEAS